MSGKISNQKGSIILVIFFVVAVLVLGLGAAYFFGKQAGFLSQPAAPETKTAANDSSQAPVKLSAPAGAYKILYAYTDYRTHEVKAYSAQSDGGDKRELAIINPSQDPQEVYRFLASPDATRLVRWSQKLLDVSTSKDLPSFKNLVTNSLPNHRITNVVWDETAPSLLYMITEDLEPNIPFGKVENKIYSLSVDGAENRLVKTFQSPEFVILEGVSKEKQEFYEFATGDGGFVSGFTVFSLVDGSVKSTKEGIDPSLRNIVYTHNFGKAFFAKDYSIYEYDLANDTKKQIFTLSPITQDQYGNKSRLESIFLAPDESRLIFSVHDGAADKSSSYRLNLADGSREVLLDDVKYPLIVPQGISPDGKTLWMSTSCFGCGVQYGTDNEGEYYTMDLTDKSLHLFYRAEKGEYLITGKGMRYNTGLSFLGWLKN